MPTLEDMNELIRKFTDALTLFSDRSATLETRVLGELEGVRNDIKKLRKEVFDDNAISIPQVMEQQRITIIELIRQMQPHLSVDSSKPIKQDSSQIVDTPKQETQKPSQQELSEISIVTATPKQETPKQATPKYETPKTIQEETPKQETPKEATPKTIREETPKPTTPKQETPKPIQQETPKQETPKPIQQETPKPIQQEIPKPIQQETPQPIQPEIPKQETQKQETPKQETPKQETPKPIQEELSEISIFAATPKPAVVPLQFGPKQVQSPIIVESVQPQKNQSGFGSGFTLKGEEWYCTGCYVKNAAGSTECLSCQTSKSSTGQPSPQQKPAFKPQSFTNEAINFFSPPNARTTQSPQFAQPTQPVQHTQSTVQKPTVSFSFAPNKTAVAAPTTQSQAIGLFGGSAQKAADQKPQNPVSFSFAPSFGTPKVVPVATQENKSIFGSAFRGNSNFGEGAPAANSFASLAGNTGSTINTQAPQSNNFTAFRVKANSMAVQTLPQSFVPDDSQFRRPTIPMPGLVETKSGEENEDVLFLARCRLYRFLPGGNVIERGTGDIKLLKHRGTGKTRCVMRPETGLTLCANFGVLPGFTVKNMKSGENVLTWACHDYSDPAFPDGENTTLICRFKDVGTAMNFKQIVHSVTV